MIKPLITVTVKLLSTATKAYKGIKRDNIFTQILLACEGYYSYTNTHFII